MRITRAASGQLGVRQLTEASEHVAATFLDGGLRVVAPT